MKRNDGILLAVILLIAAVLAGYQFLRPVSDGAKVEITVDGELFGTYSLKKDQTVSIGDTNQLEIKDGEAKMSWADCPDQLCVNQKAISKNGESIICLPNEIVISVIDGEESEIDAVTN